MICVIQTEKKPVWTSFQAIPPHLTVKHAGVAQLVERKALNLVVKGSSPFFGGKIFCLRMRSSSICTVVLGEKCEAGASNQQVSKAPDKAIHHLGTRVTCNLRGKKLR